MFASKMAFVVNVPVSTKDLKKALEESGQNLTNESMFKAKYELKYLLERELPVILNEVAQRLSNRSAIGG